MTDIPNGLTKSQDDGWVIDLNAIKAKERKALNATIQEAREAGDDMLMVPWFVRVIKKWPFADDPADPNAYPELGMGELIEVAKHVNAAFQRLME